MADPRFHGNQGPFSLSEIAALIGCDVKDADKDIKISDVAPLDKAEPGQLSFLDNVKYKDQLSICNATVCILHPKMLPDAPEGLIALVTEKPYKAYAMVAQLFYPSPKGAFIHPTAVIEDNVILGKNCHIGAHVTISHAILGDNVRIHNGARIGQDGFGFAIDETGCVPVPQLGRVQIEDNVNIGANTCIDRGASGDTIIGAGTIIDNLCQIAHGVVIGKGCIIVSQVGISGSTRIGDYCVFGGQSGVAGHLNIGTGVQIGAQSGVTKDVESGKKMMGFPARPIREFWREMAQIKKLLSK